VRCRQKLVSEVLGAEVYDCLRQNYESQVISLAKIDVNFRQAFSRMAPQALINRDELASLLATTSGAISQMAYRGELPPKAFPEKRRACWFVADIRAWLDDAAAKRRHDVRQVTVVRSTSELELMRSSSEEISDRPRIGRPRKNAKIY
jgi:predicted DNA-binding transcriptional regulator AlpA